MVKKRFDVRGMECVGCTMAVEAAIERLAGVKQARANYARQVVEVEYDDSRLSEAEIVAAVQMAGYEASLPA